MALNVLINTMPAAAYPSKNTSFFPPDIQKDSTEEHERGMSSVLPLAQVGRLTNSLIQEEAEVAEVEVV